MLQVTTRFFALYRERAGTDSLQVALDDGARVSDLVRHLARRYPHLTPDPDAMVVAVNQEYVQHDHALRSGDEVAFIPPLSGGRHD
ncbi:MAG: molybdopterin converting factor subunit 1 [Chloroflexi bacterium]|nr:molybdopterin converting factor subunit 1 [Chloroflexota bacterium]